MGRLRGYRDVTEGTNVDVGTSFAYGHNAVGEDFTTRVIGVDATVRYRPLRRAIYRRFIGRTELMWSRQGQEAGDMNAFGLYGSADYQFARRWFAGARYDWSSAPTIRRSWTKGRRCSSPTGRASSARSGGSMAARGAPSATANELLFQFLFSIGAHGATF